MWKNLKGLFIVEEKTGKQPAKQQEASARETAGKSTKPTVTSPSRAANPPPPPPAPTSGGTVKDKFVKVLLEAMEAANLPGFDYLEYKKVLQSLEKMNFDDSTRFQTAYAGAQSMGVTPQQLVGSAQHYLSTLAREEDKFKLALDNQKQQQIGQNRELLQRYSNEVNTMTAEIAKLEKEIEKKQQQQEALRKKVETSAAKLAITEANFGKTYQTITGQIHEDIKKMNIYLK